MLAYVCILVTMYLMWTYSYIGWTRPTVVVAWAGVVITIGRQRCFGVSLKSDLEWIETFLYGRLAEILDDCLRSDHNHALFYLLTLLKDPL